MTDSGKLKHIIVTVCFIAAMFLPVITQLSGVFSTDYIKTIEKREPKTKPAPPESWDKLKSYTDALEAYLNDHFGFRFQFVLFNNTLRFLIGLSSANGVYVGKNNWLFSNFDYSVHQYTGMMNFSDSELDYWIRVMEHRGAFLESKNIKYYVIVPPNKITIYPEYIPDYIGRPFALPRLQQLEMSSTRMNHFSFLSLRPYLLEEKASIPVYYQTDSHWNNHGAYFAYREIMRLINKDFSGLQALSTDDLDLSLELNYNRDLTTFLNLAFPVPDLNGDRLKFKKATHVLNTEYINEPSRNMHIVTTDRNDGLVALIFGDSFTIPLEPLFNETFKTIIYAKNDKTHFDASLIESYHPDIVLYIMVERFLKFVPEDTVTPRSASSPFIQAFGPENVIKGTKFYKQPNGMSAMWVKGENFNGDCEIVWEDQALPTSIYEKGTVVTALVPDDLYSDMKRYEIRIRNKITNEISNSVFLTVSQNL